MSMHEHALLLREKAGEWTSEKAGEKTRVRGQVSPGDLAWIGVVSALSIWWEEIVKFWGHRPESWGREGQELALTQLCEHCQGDSRQL